MKQGWVATEQYYCVVGVSHVDLRNGIEPLWLRRQLLEQAAGQSHPVGFNYRRTGADRTQPVDDRQIKTGESWSILVDDLAHSIDQIQLF